MTIFRIVASRPQNDDKPAQFDISISEGELKVGDEFWLYETHHPARFEIVQTTRMGEDGTITVKGAIPWSEQWVGTVVNTEDPEAGIMYGYGVRPKNES